MLPYCFYVMSTKVKVGLCTGAAIVTTATGACVGTSITPDNPYPNGVPLECASAGVVGYSVSPTTYNSRVITPDVYVEEDVQTPVEDTSTPVSIEETPAPVEETPAPVEEAPAPAPAPAAKEVSGTSLEAGMWNYIVSLGIKGVSDNPACIAGILGNFYAESGYDPLIVGNGRYYGLYQLYRGNDLRDRVNEALGGNYWGSKVSDDMKLKAAKITIDYLVSTTSFTDYFLKYLDSPSSKMGNEGVAAYAELFMMTVERCVYGSGRIQDPGVAALQNQFNGWRGQGWQGRDARVNYALAAYARCAGN